MLYFLYMYWNGICYIILNTTFINCLNNSPGNESHISDFHSVEDFRTCDISDGADTDTASQLPQKHGVLP